MATSSLIEPEDTDPLNIDSMIIGYMNKTGISWDDLVKIHNSHKESKEICLDGIPLDVKEILQYIRSLSRVLIHLNINIHKKENSNFYAIIAGSTNITSDYDVTFVGKGASKRCNKIVSSFRIHTGGDLAKIADSNIYIGPACVIEKGRIYPDWFEYESIGNDQAFPLPLSEISIQKEISAVLKRDGFEDHRSISKKYDDMIEKGQILEDRFYYPLDGTVTGGEEELWDLLHGINFDAMEAYITLSTIIAIVVEIQMGIEVEKLESIHYLIAAFENMINFIDHNGGTSVSDESKLLKNSKYIYRIIKCLLKSVIAEKIGDIDMDNINYIISQRGSPSENLYSSSQFNKFREDTVKVMGLKEEIKTILVQRLGETSMPLASVTESVPSISPGKRKRRKQGKRKTRKIRRSKKRIVIK